MATKTTAEYAAHPSVAGLTGAAKKAAIKALYDADKAAETPAPRAKLPSAKALAQKAREYDNAHHDLKVTRETDKAVAVAVVVDFCDIERASEEIIWIPKSVLIEGRAPGWIITKKIDEVGQAARQQKLGSVYVRLA